MSLAVLGRILFDQGAPYAPDPGAFFKFTSDLADALLGDLSWFDVLRQTGERTLTYMLPVAVVAALTGFRTPEFYMAVAWTLYVLPLPFLYLLLVRAFRPPAIVDYAVAALFLAITPLLNLGVLYFTDVPGLTIALAGLACLAHGLNGPSIWRMSFGFFLLAMATSVRIMNAVPYFMSMVLLAWLMWPLVAAAHREVLKAIALAIGASLVAEAILRFDIPIVYMWRLNSEFGNTIWKYGSGSTEYGIENLFSFRFRTFIVAAVVWFLPFLVILTTGIASGRVIVPGEPERRRPWLSIAALIGFLLFCAYNAIIMFANDRYVVPALLILVPILCATAIPKAVGSVLTILSVLFCADALYYHWGRHGQPAPLSTAMSGIGLGWMAPIGPTAFRDVIDVTPSVVNALLAAGATKGPVSVEVLAPSNPLFDTNSLSLYLRYMAPTSEVFAGVQKNIRIVTTQAGEFSIPEIYSLYAARNMLAFANADFIFVPIDDDRPFPYTSFWKETTLLAEVRQVAEQKREAVIGLAQVAALMGGFREKAGDVPIRYKLFKVTDSLAWSSVVRKHFCVLQGINDPLFSIWCGKFSLAGETHDIAVVPTSLASSASIIERPEGAVLKLELKWPPKSGFSRIYVHFVPQLPAYEACPFFVVDHDVTEKGSLEDYTVFPVERLINIRQCKYVVNVGVRADALARNINNASEFERAMKPN